MSHYDLPDTTKISEAEAALRCARLNFRGGKRRLQKGLTTAGIVALYDSVLFGMRYYIASHKSCASFVQNTDPWDAASLFHALTRAGVFENSLTFNRFSLIVERALWQESFSFDAAVTLTEVENMLAKLDVIPVHHSRSSRKVASVHR